MSFSRLALTICFVLGTVEYGIEGRQSIPAELEECYGRSAEGHGDVDGDGPPIPATLRVLLDILRKAEKSSATYLDLRTFSASLLHRFKFDGIEYSAGTAQRAANQSDVLPFAATGPQRKRQRVLERAIPGNAGVFPSAALTTFERCALHRFLSNTIDAGPSASRCLPPSRWRTEPATPIEYGVIETAYGTVAPGPVIAGIAAALQPQAVSASRSLLDGGNFNLDNVCLATLPGDLAKVLVYQGITDESAITFGASGSWRSTIFPRLYYHSRSQSYDATRAEIIGDIDGLVLARKAVVRLGKYRTMRLSQLLDGYYSESGLELHDDDDDDDIGDIGGNTRPIRACDRLTNFQLTASKTLLEEQSFAASRLLIASEGAPAHITDEALARLTDRALTTFYAYIEEKLSRQNYTCARTGNQRRTLKKATVEAILILDQRNILPEKMAQTIGSLIDRLDVSAYGSKIGMLDGTSAEWWLNVTDSPSIVYRALSSSRFLSEPSELAHASVNYTLVLEKISGYLDEVWTRRREDRVIGNLGQAIVSFLSPTSMTTDEQSSVLVSLKRLKLRHPDVYFFYCPTKSNSQYYYRPFLLTEDDRLIPDCLTDDLALHLRQVPKTLRPTQPIPPFTEAQSNHQFEDYASPTSPSSSAIIYRIHPEWRRRTKNFLITIHGFGYGVLEICRWVDSRSLPSIGDIHEQRREGENLSCSRLSEHETLSLRYTGENDCAPPNCDTYIRVRAISSLRKCAEIDCQFPDQVRYIVRSRALQQGNSAALSAILHQLSHYFILCHLFNVI